jgi:hypothetical protein
VVASYPSSRPSELATWLSNPDHAILMALVVIGLCAFVLAAGWGKKGGDRAFRLSLLGAKLLIIAIFTIYTVVFTAFK